MTRQTLDQIWSLYEGEADRVGQFRRIAEMVGYSPAQIEEFLDADSPAYRQDELE